MIDSFGCTHDTTMNVLVSENPIAAFTFSDECFGTATAFADQSNDNGGLTPIDSWDWDFDNDGVVDNTTPSPTYTFPASGVYPAGGSFDNNNDAYDFVPQFNSSGDYLGLSA